MTDDDRTLCATTAAWLDAAGALAAWGLALAAIAVAVVLAFELPGVGASAALHGVVLLALAERYLALRLRFDASLFRGLADGRIGSAEGLDGALARLALRPAGPGPRLLQDRVDGALRLLRMHRNAVLLQTVLALAALVLLALPADTADDGAATTDMTWTDMQPEEATRWTTT